MTEHLPTSSIARRFRAVRAGNPRTSGTPGSITPIEPARAGELADFEHDVHAAREAVFALADAAHRCFSKDHTQLHVSLQIVSNELGDIERLLNDVSAAAPGPAAKAS